jgi:hypothetical protein
MSKICKAIFPLLTLGLLSGAAEGASDYGKRAQALEPAVRSRLLGHWVDHRDHLDQSRLGTDPWQVDSDIGSSGG